ncbi:MAG: PTS sugar transporter subunit IIA [Candidatus Krumholzibacteriota bacterium]|nr:PTS sugar transporter subunit IIA [Candidatus Krumholzibacteriota bacterium]
MRLIDHISPAHISVGLEGTDKEEVVEELVELLGQAECLCDADSILEAVMSREREGSTGLERGIAIPHAKCDAVERLSIAIGISRDGVDFDAQDGKPSYLFFLMVAPSTESGPHVQAIAKIVKMIKVERFRERMLAAKTPEEVLDVIGRVENGEE